MSTTTEQIRTNQTDRPPEESVTLLGVTVMDELMNEQSDIVIEDQAQQPSSPEIDRKLVVAIHKIPDLPVGFYNAAALKLDNDPNSPTLLLGRSVKESRAQGQTDAGSLLLVVLDGGKVTSMDEMWRPEDPETTGDQLEDIRVVVTADNQVLLGCTRLAFNAQTGFYAPFPAVAVTTSEALRRGEFPSTNYIKGFGEGDQTTPIGEGANRLQLLSGKNVTPLGPNNFMFRREVDDHQLLVFSVDEENQVKQLQYLKFPQDQIPWWGERKMGTTMPLVWLNQTEALFIVHGQRLVNGKPEYAIGTARLFINQNGEYEIDNVSPEPLLTPKMLEAEFPGEQVQLHPNERQAIYMVGGVVEYDNFGQPTLVHGYPSVGDSRTLEAIFSVPAITAGWQRGESVGRGSPVAA